MKKSSLLGLYPQARGLAISGLSKQAGTTRMGLPWGYGGVNISPMAVPAPEEDVIDEVFNSEEVGG